MFDGLSVAGGTSMRLGIAVLAVLVLAGACTRIQDIRPVGDVGVVPAGPTAQTRTVAYELPPADSAGLAPDVTILRGTACRLGSQRAARTSLYVMIARDYADVFQDEFRRAGYRTRDPVNPTLPTNDGAGTDVRIVGVMSDVRANVCLPAVDLGDLSDGKGEASMTVQWQVYVPGRKDAAYVTAQPGYARIDTPVAAAGRELLRAAFARAIHGLLADKGFRDVMQAPVR
jgi:hypothetical protein